MTKEVSTLSEFIEWTEQFSDGEYLFRGVSKATYKIEAAAYRRLPKAERNKPNQLLAVNQEMIEKARLLGHDEKDGRELSDLELLAELQHFGAATCLIDFSRNALVALWFACQQSSSGEASGKICAVRSDDPALFKKVNLSLVKKDINHFFKTNEKDAYSLYQWEPKHQNNRIIAQQSIFIFGGAEIKAEAECVIVKNNKQVILTSLDKVSGITEASIYPDFDGFARQHAHSKHYAEPDVQDYLRRGIEADKQGNSADAITHYTKAISLKPDNPTLAETYYNLGDVYFTKEKHDLAIKEYSNAIEVKPDFAEAYHSRGNAYRHQNDYKNALEDYDAAIRLKPDFSRAYYDRAIAYDNEGDYEDALEDYDAAIRLKPDFSRAYYD